MFSKFCRYTASAAVIASLLGGAAYACGDEAMFSDGYPIYTVDEVAVTHDGATPGIVTVTASGEVMGVWENVRLVPIQTWDDTSVMSFVLTGTPLESATEEATLRVSASITMSRLPEGVTSIRVMSETNEAALELYPALALRR